MINLIYSINNILYELYIFSVIMCWSLLICVFQRPCPIHLNCHFFSCVLLIKSLYYLFIIWGNSLDFYSFIPDFVNLHSFSFFLILVAFMFFKCGFVFTNFSLLFVFCFFTSVFICSISFILLFCVVFVCFLCSFL